MLFFHLFVHSLNCCKHNSSIFNEFVHLFIMHIIFPRMYFLSSLPRRYVRSELVKIFNFFKYTIRSYILCIYRYTQMIDMHIYIYIHRRVYVSTSRFILANRYFHPPENSNRSYEPRTTVARDHHVFLIYLLTFFFYFIHKFSNRILFN